MKELASRRTNDDFWCSEITRFPTIGNALAGGKILAHIVFNYLLTTSFFSMSKLTIKFDGGGSTFSFQNTLGIDTRLLCACCGGSLGRRPVTGRCGHSICSDCHQQEVLLTLRPGYLKPCPMKGCRSNESFDMVGLPSSSIVFAEEILEEAERATRSHIWDLMEEMKLHDARKDKERITSLTTKISDRNKRIDYLERKLAEARDEILCMENRNYGMVRFTDSLLRRLDNTPGANAALPNSPDVPSTVAVIKSLSGENSVDSVSTLGFTQKLDKQIAAAEKRWAREAKRKTTGTTTSCDTSSGSFAPVLKRKPRKPRKVSMETSERRKDDGSVSNSGTSEAEFQ